MCADRKLTRYANFGRQKRRGGPSLGSRAPKGRVPVIRPRRDRIMGSSILASLSEAGGNDPFLPMSGPLPPHSPVGADRVGTRPTPPLMQIRGPLQGTDSARGAWVLNELMAAAGHPRPIFEADSGIPIPDWKSALLPRFPRQRSSHQTGLTFRTYLRSKLVRKIPLQHNESLKA